MNLVRCMNGHFYDAERFDDCPHCNQTTIRPEDGEDFITRPISPPEDPGLGVEIGAVVGWLVCIEGNHFGEDFKLKTGKNFIGRSSAMDVVLSGDASVSRDRHAIVVYEPKSNIFLVQPGDSKELFYVNDEVVLSAQEIKGYDVLSVGNSKLMFIPCCSDRFNWDAVKNEEK